MKNCAASKLNLSLIARRYSQQADELRSRSEQIEHLKLMIEKLRHMILRHAQGEIVIKLNNCRCTRRGRDHSCRVGGRSNE